ncbi:hypothetical protein KA344_15590 [bacterium]|nr:hypothetical protein [bacterium]
MNAQDILEKSFAVVRDLDTFVLHGNWVSDWHSLTSSKLSQSSSKSFQLSYRKPNEIVLVFHDSDLKFKFVGSSIFIKGPEDERARFIGGDGLTASLSGFQASSIPDELFTFIRFCLNPKENCLWYVKRNSFRLVQVKEQANKLFLEGDLGSSGIVRLTVSSISYFIHAVEITNRPVNSEFSRDILNVVVKTAEIFQTIASFGQAEKAELDYELCKPSSIHVETELSFARVSLNPKLSDADFSL